MADNANGYDDRGSQDTSKDPLPKPQIEIIVDGDSVFKPGMKTYFVDDMSYDASHEKFEYESKVMGTYCSCDTVLVTRTTCSCVEYTVSTPHVNPGTGGSGSSSTSTSHGPTSGGTVSCGSPCACVPVH